MNSILHSTKSLWGMMRKILGQYRAHYLPGLITFLVFFGISNVLNFSFSYMGNTNPEVAKAILVNFWGTIILQILKVLIAYGVIGALLGVLVFRAVIEAGRTFHRSPGYRTAAGFTVGILVFSTMLQFCEKIIINPQLYVENFASHSWLFLSFQMFLTDNIHPLVFSVPLYIIMLLVVCFALKPVALREVKALFTRIISFRFRWYAAGVICVMIIFMVLYQQRVIFYEEDRRPNILILSSDAVRSDHFSANGYSRSTTPNIDRVINRSLQFRGVMTAVPRTFPSWVSILTSQYPLSHNIKHMFPRSRDRNIFFDTACTALNAEGYRTGVISDFAGDIFPRIDLGFKYTRAPHFNFTALVKQIIIEKQTLLLPFISNGLGMLLFPEMRGIAKYSHHRMVSDETIDYIDSARGRPFFLTVFYSITHFPFAAPYPYYQKYAREGYRGPYKYYKQVVIQMDNGSGTTGEDTAEDREQVISLYDGCLNLFDLEVGRVMAHLRKQGLLDNTIVVITSDHGENLYDHNLGMGHGEHLKGYPALEIPFIIHYPGKRDLYTGTKKGFFSSIDIMPTLFACAGIRKPEFFRGRSLVSENRDTGNGINSYSETGLWFDNNKSSPLFFHHARIDYPDITGISDMDMEYNREIVIQQRYQNITNAAKYRAIISGKYKLIYIPLPGGSRFELYDQEKDPFNQHNIAKLHNGILQKMKKLFFDFVVKESNNNFIVNR
ncbi:MAG TPA: sulfatase-like hydrolase/transferase, partial [Spirochaetota bacterium]|nr:sulfatase-like hydrolase/transferase [Spirochaetota bacterium]